MKILVAYFSQTGNTEKIAQAIQEESLQANETELHQIEGIDPAAIDAYDFVFIGSPLHAGNLAAPVKEFLDQMRVKTGQRLACFITHAAPAYPEQDMSQFSEPIRSFCDKNGLQFTGHFGCQGYLTEALHEMIKNRQGLTDEQWAEKVELMRGHPDDEDLIRARDFAKKVLGASHAV